MEHVDLAQLSGLSICVPHYIHLFYFQALCQLFQGRPEHSLSLAQGIYKLILKAKSAFSQVLPLLALLSVITPCEETLVNSLRQVSGYSRLA